MGPIFQENVVAKCDRIRADGLAVLNKGSVQTFSGFPESLKKRFGVIALFTLESLSVLDDRVLKPLRVIERELELSLFLAGREYPPHTTVAEGEYEGDDIGEMFAELKAADIVAVVQRDLTGLEITYSRLLPDKGNVLINSIDIPNVVVSGRELLGKLYSSKGLKAMPIHDILHSSLSRMRSYGTGAGVIERYTNKLLLLERQIAADPVTLTIGEVYAGPSYAFVNGEVIAA